MEQSHEQMIKKFYETYDWFEKFFQDIHCLLKRIGKLLNNEFRANNEDYSFREGNYYAPKQFYPRLPNPYFARFGNKIGICVFLKYDKLMEYEGWKDLEKKLKEPLFMVFVSNNNWWEKRWYFLTELKINNEENFEFLYENCNFKGFFVPLLEFSKTRLQKEPTDRLDETVDKIIKDKIIKPLGELLKSQN